MVNKKAQNKKFGIFSLHFKKAQMKIQQMAFMLIAITIFFGIVGMLALTIRLSGLKGQAELLQEENAKLLVTKLANSPEFSCGESFGTRKTNCVDGDKAMVLKENLEDYSRLWGDLNIEIRIIYPVQTSEKPCTRDNYPDCNYIQLGDGDVSGDFSNFVAFCRKEKIGNKIENKCELAKIFVNYEDIE